MNTLLRNVPIVAWLLMIGLPAPALAANDASMEWNFTVFLDDSPIGYHHFKLSDEGGVQRIESEAEFKVRFLFITAYRYEHANSETWANNCLQQLVSRTDANGESFNVTIDREAGDLQVDSSEGNATLEGCVRTFAYWNPDILRDDALLNAQTGEMLEVDIEPVATEMVMVRGEETEATRYRLLARDMKLDIWYAAGNRWVALESTIKGGRKLRYELT